MCWLPGRARAARRARPGRGRPRLRLARVCLLVRSLLNYLLPARSGGKRAAELQRGSPLRPPAQWLPACGHHDTSCQLPSQQRSEQLSVTAHVCLHASVFSFHSSKTAREGTWCTLKIAGSLESLNSWLGSRLGGGVPAPSIEGCRVGCVHPAVRLHFSAFHPAVRPAAVLTHLHLEAIAIDMVTPPFIMS